MASPPGGVPFHETVTARGYSDDCMYNDHTQCRSPRCGCDCHRAARVVADSSSVERVSGGGANMGGSQTRLGDKVCPLCKLRGPLEQNYCKVDGARLSSLLCPECASPGEPEDNYCGFCGAGMGGRHTDAEVEAVALPESVAGMFAEREIVVAPVVAPVASPSPKPFIRPGAYK